MRNIFFAVTLALGCSGPMLADSVPPPAIEVELGGRGTDTWTDVVELHEVAQPDWFWFADGTSLPPGSVWMAFLWPSGEIGLSSPLTWRYDPAPLASTDIPEPSSLVLVCLGLVCVLGLYVVQNDSRSTCRHCGEPVDLLCDSAGNTRKAWFYVCWSCKVIAQVGVGEVQREED